jgi:predicted transcriptional regulator
MKSQPLSIRLQPELNEEVAKIAAALDRPKSWVVEQAVKDYVAAQQWQLAAIDEGLSAADAGRFAKHEDVLEWVRSWGQPDELPPPKCG